RAPGGPTTGGAYASTSGRLDSVGVTISLDGRRFAALADVVAGEVGLELHESWAWESRPGNGTSVVREIA
ncbi:hypothetical protein AB0J68_32355, partial [Micromonospora sp. NPDC049580]